MQYWGSMLNKYGFSDGEAVPFGIEYYRSVYVKVVNTLAAQKGSAVRVVPYDRPGWHNTCMVLFVPVMWFEQTYIPLQFDKLSIQTITRLGYRAITEEPDCVEVGDEAMCEAIDAAHLLNLDAAVTITARIEQCKVEDILYKINTVSKPGTRVAAT